jgi:hypothetical protein
LRTRIGIRWRPPGIGRAPYPHQIVVIPGPPALFAGGSPLGGVRYVE